MAAVGRRLTLLQHRRRGESGQAMVEFAIVLPVLILLVLGITEFGRALSALIVLQNAAREGARYGITVYSDPNSNALIEDKVRQEANALDGAADPIRLEVTITPADPGVRAPGGDLSISLQYDFDFVTPFFGSGLMIRSSMSMQM